MPQVLVEGTRDEGFILSEGNGYQSREEITVAQSATTYQAGSIIMKVGTSYQLATADLLSAGGNDGADISILLRKVNAKSGAKKAGAFVRNGEVKDSELVFGTGVSLTHAEVVAAFAAKNIIVRNAL